MIRPPLPENIVVDIQDWLWGRREDWRRRFAVILSQLQCRVRVVHDLRDVGSYWLMGSAVDAEDCLYCERCGEKRLWFPFALSTDRLWCDDCNERLRPHVP